MNRVDYINALKSALEINKEEREYIEQCHKWALECQDDAQLNAFISLVNFLLAFYNPMNRVLNLITNRLREEYLYDWDISKCSFTLMTIEKVYENMTQDISFDTSCDIIIDKHLVCCPYAKSELKRSIKERNLQLFKDTIKEYNIDYKPASDYCSHICLNSNIQRDIRNRFDKAVEEYRNAEELHKEDILKGYSLRYRAICEDVQSKMKKKYREDGWSYKDVTDFNRIIEKVLKCPLDFSSPDTLINSMTINCKRGFYQSVHSLSAYAKAHLLNEYDKSLIGTFIEKKKTDMPIVQEYFALFTKGDVLGDDFVFTEPEDVDFLEMIEQDVSGETNEQQVLPDDENTGISNFKIVANPTLAELPLPHVLAWDENKAREIIMRAIYKGYMELLQEEQQYIYNWRISKIVALVYFCGRLCCGDYTEYAKKSNVKSEWIKGDGEELPKTELLKLFRYKRNKLKEGSFQYRRDSQKRSFYKTDNYKMIDELFENQQL
jgi:hypothetical protein